MSVRSTSGAEPQAVSIAKDRIGMIARRITNLGLHITEQTQGVSVAGEIIVNTALRLKQSVPNGT